MKISTTYTAMKTMCRIVYFGHSLWPDSELLYLALNGWKLTVTMNIKIINCELGIAFQTWTPYLSFSLAFLLVGLLFRLLLVCSSFPPLLCSSSSPSEWYHPPRYPNSSSERRTEETFNKNKNAFKCCCGRLGEGCLSGVRGCLTKGWCLPELRVSARWGACLRGGVCLGGVHLRPVNRITGRCKNITFPPLQILRTVTKEYCQWSISAPLFWKPLLDYLKAYGLTLHCVQYDQKQMQASWVIRPVSILF